MAERKTTPPTGAEPTQPAPATTANASTQTTPTRKRKPQDEAAGQKAAKAAKPELPSVIEQIKALAARAWAWLLLLVSEAPLPMEFAVSTTQEALVLPTCPAQERTAENKRVVRRHLSEPLPIEAMTPPSRHEDIMAMPLAELLPIADAVYEQLKVHYAATGQGVSKSKHPREMPLHNLRLWVTLHLPEVMPFKAMLKDIGVTGDFSDCIGIGSTSLVYRGTCSSDGDKLVAIKKLKYSSVTSSTMQFEKEHFMFEAQLRAQLEHEHIVKFYRFLPSWPPAIVQELGDCNLLKYVLIDGPQREPVVARFVKELTEGLAYLHGRGICHADMKLCNILMGTDGHLRIADFGSAYYEWSAPVPKRGTPSTWAPELFKDETWDTTVDIWALGVMTYELLVGDHPVTDTPLGTMSPPLSAFKSAMSSIESKVQIKVEAQPISAEVKDLLLRMLEPRPEERICLEDILTHEWVRRHTDV